MIIKKNSTYEVRSKNGKLLGKYLSEAAAKRRLKIYTELSVGSVRCV